MAIAWMTFSALPLKGWMQCQPGCFHVQGEFLYWTPSYDETYFVINGSGIDGLGAPTPNGKKVNNPVGFGKGFRLEGVYRYNNSCFDIGLRWTHLRVLSRKTVSNQEIPAQLWPTESIPNLPGVPTPFSGAATSRINVMHQKGEAFFEEELGCNFGCRFILREAVEWSYIRYQETVNYNAAAAAEQMSFHAHTKGIGPQLGIIALFEPWNLTSWCPRDLAFKVLTSGSLIVANAKSKVTGADTFGFQNKITQNSFWKLVPEWTIEAAFRYVRCCCSFPVSIEVGYAFTTYIRGISKLIFYEASNPGLSFNQYSDFYVHGLYASLGFGF